MLVWRACYRNLKHVGSPAELSVLGSTRPLCTALPPELVAPSAAQIKLCSLHADHIPAVKRGALLALDECQWQFRNRRWNCSVPPSQMTTKTTTTVSDDEQKSAAAVAELLAPSITIGDNLIVSLVIGRKQFPHGKLLCIYITNVMQ